VYCTHKAHFYCFDVTPIERNLLVRMENSIFPHYVNAVCWIFTRLVEEYAKRVEIWLLAPCARAADDAQHMKYFASLPPTKELNSSLRIQLKKVFTGAAFLALRHFYSKRSLRLCGSLLFISFLCSRVLLVKF
jgi:hypothetical protein